MNGFFSIFGKISLVIFIILLLLAGGYYVGRGKIALPENNPPVAATTMAPEALTTPTPTTPATKTINAGVASGLSFGLYTVEVPQSWTVAQEHEDQPSPMDTLTLTSGLYVIKIFQAATGGAMCLYPGDADFEGPSSRFDTFVALTTKDGTSLRRSGTTVVSGATRGFTVCQKSSDGSYGQPTGYGHMSITTPLSPDSAMLTEIDSIISSLKK